MASSSRVCVGVSVAAMSCDYDVVMFADGVTGCVDTGVADTVALSFGSKMRRLSPVAILLLLLWVSVPTIATVSPLAACYSR